MKKLFLKIFLFICIFAIYITYKTIRIENYIEKGRLYMKSEDYENAILNFQEALNLAPNNLQANILIHDSKVLYYVKKGMQCVKTGDNKNAILNFQEALNLAPCDSTIKKMLDDAKRYEDINKRENNIEETNNLIEDDSYKESNVSQRYLPYYNSRYGFTIIYPSNFVKGQSPDNGDGMEFFSPDGLEKILAYGSNDSSVFGFKNVKDAMEQEMQYIDAKIEYKHIGENWYVISYKINNTIYYMKTYVGKGCTNTLLIQYPINLKEKYEKLIPELIRLFKPGDLNNPH